MVNDNAIKVTYQGDGKTTVFPFSFPFDKVEYIHIAIYDTETKEIVYPEKDYIVDEVARTVTYPGYAEGQGIKESERPAVLDKTKRITIFRSTDIDQLVDLGEKYPLATLEGIADKVTEILQELKEQLSRAILVKLGSGEDPQNVYNSIWDYAKTKAEEAFGEPAVTDKIQQVIDEATAAAQKELAVLDANDILGKVTDLQKTDEKLESTIAQNKTDTDKAVSDLKQTADSITATVAQNKTDAETAISKVDQKADSISATVQANKTSTDTAISNVNQRADSITSTVQEQKEQFDGKIGGLSSQITQNADSITSVVTNLKDSSKAKQAGYSSITQLQDEVNLRVKTSDYNGKNIINQINVNSGGVVIDGSRVHITGDTKIDKDLIVAGNIKAGSITLDNLSQETVAALSQVIMVQGDDGQTCTFKIPYKATPQVYTVGISYNKTLSIYNASQNVATFRTVTDPSNVTNKGFTINARAEVLPLREFYVMESGWTNTLEEVGLEKQIKGRWDYTAICDGDDLTVTAYAALSLAGAQEFGGKEAVSITVNGITQTGWSHTNDTSGSQHGETPSIVYTTYKIKISVKKGDKISLYYEYNRAQKYMLSRYNKIEGWKTGDEVTLITTGRAALQVYNTAAEMYTLS